MQAVNSEFNPDELYRPIRNVGSEYEQEEASLSEDYKKARDRYTQYVKDTANVLLTFKPVLDSKKLHVIIRVLDNSIEEMKMDEYLLGVVSAEMPADFEEEALKAVIAGIENGLGE